MRLSQRVATRVRASLSGPRSPALVALVAVLLSLPALALGFMSDDHILAWQLALGDGPWGLFKLTEARLSELRATGAIAWWASPRLYVSFFRPLASLSHYVDFTLWPRAAWLMTLWNVLLYGLAVLFAGLTYRRLTPSPSVAGLAAFMFAVNEAHGMSVGWISGRNTVMALLGSLAALHFHVRARQERRPAFALLSILALGFGLLSAEAGTWALGLLLAYALVLEPGSWRARLVSVGPQLTLGAIWAGVYLALGSGVHGTSFYRELSTPFRALMEGVLDLPLALTSLFGPGVIGFALMSPVHLARLVALPLAAACVWLVWPSRELREQPSFRFFVAATFACLPPAFLAIAQDRTLIGASFGAFGWIALAIDAAARVPGRAARLRRGALLGLHVFIALPLFLMNLGSVRRFENGTQALVGAMEPGREVVLVNTPVELLSDYAFAVLEGPSRPHPPPLSLHQLYAGTSELWLERVDAHTLDVTATSGWGRVPFERIFCPPEDMPRPGTEVRVRGLLIRVLTATPEGMPETVRFTFDGAIDAEERQWLVWEGTTPVPFTPPAVGQRVRLPPLFVLGALPQ
jgi:hypothetical protein